MAKIDDALNSYEPLSYFQLIGLTFQFNTRIDTLWQRVLYAHAAMVGVMVFFFNSPNPLEIPRILVFAFYTINLILTFFALRDAYTGLRATVSDLRNFPQGDAPTQVGKWITSQNYERHTLRRGITFAVIWAVLAYLLIVPIML